MILIIGKNGQLARAFIKLLGKDETAFSSQEINFLNRDFTDILSAILARNYFSTIINTAAYTQVDKAETESDIALRINGEAIGELARWCRKNDVRLIHYSTDYVFDGSGMNPRKEDEQTSPLNIYGKSKLLGEELISKSGAEHLIFRTSWLYDETGKNFLTTMFKFFYEQQEIKVVNDQIGAPTYVADLAKASILALNNAEKLPRFPSGIYNLCAKGETSWHGFAEAILTIAKKHQSEVESESKIKCQHIIPISSSEYKTPAKRPLNSRLDCSKAKEILGVSIADWKIGLKSCYASKFM